ncbi:MAG: carbohydrate kinase family protein [bacterium]
MKIGVVGTFIRDRIFPWQGDPVESIGGVFFTVSFLANLLDSSAEIYPVSLVGEDFYDTLINQLADYKNVRIDGIKKIPQKHTQVKLIYTGPQERYEITTEPMPALTYEELIALQDADAVLVNLITGVDVDLKALSAFRQISKSLIYLDFHSHALGINAEGRRYYRRPEDWRDWINLVDVLQLNEMEARTLAGHTTDFPKEILIAFGKEILNCQPSVCHITLAEMGSYLFYLQNNKKRVKRFKALPVLNVVDIIGCGDAFSAGFLVDYLSSQDVEKATKLATKVAAINCTFIGSTGVKNIRRLLKKHEAVHEHPSLIFK